MADDKDGIAFEKNFKFEVPGFEHWRVKKRKSKKLRISIIKIISLLVLLEILYLDDNVELGPYRVSVKCIEESSNKVIITLKSNVLSSPYYKSSKVIRNGNMVKLVPLGSKLIFRGDNMIRLELKGEEGKEHLHKVKIDKAGVSKIKIHNKVIWEKQS